MNRQHQIQSLRSQADEHFNEGRLLGLLNTREAARRRTGLFVRAVELLVEADEMEDEKASVAGPGMTAQEPHRLAQHTAGWWAVADAETVWRVCHAIKGECSNCPAEEPVERGGKIENCTRGCYLQAVECVNIVQTGNPWRKTSEVRAPWVALEARQAQTQAVLAQALAAAKAEIAALTDALGPFAFFYEYVVRHNLRRQPRPDAYVCEENGDRIGGITFAEWDALMKAISCLSGGGKTDDISARGEKPAAAPGRPTPLFAVAQAELPPPAKHPHALALISDLNILAHSDGVHWIRQDTGAVVENLSEEGKGK